MIHLATSDSSVKKAAKTTSFPTTYLEMNWVIFGNALAIPYQQGQI